jgi:hypothetical protein
VKTIAGMFEAREDARDAIRRLEAAGYPNESVGVALRGGDDTDEWPAPPGVHDLRGEGATVGALSGVGVGALVGMALVGSHVLLPGIGPVLIGGPLIAAMTGAGIGATTGGLVGALIGAGLSPDEAERYSERLKQGHILVTLQVHDRDETAVRQIFLQEGARLA